MGCYYSDEKIEAMQDEELRGVRIRCNRCGAVSEDRYHQAGTVREQVAHLTGDGWDIDGDDAVCPECRAHPEETRAERLKRRGIPARPSRPVSESS